AIGANGVVSVASHIVGEDMAAMIHAYVNGDVQRAATLHQQLLPVMNGLFAAPSPTPVKCALQMKGVDVGGVRLTLVPLTDEEDKALRRLITDERERSISFCMQNTLFGHTTAYRKMKKEKECFLHGE